jgi:hypothetical protein
MFINVDEIDDIHENSFCRMIKTSDCQDYMMIELDKSGLGK